MQTTPIQDTVIDFAKGVYQLDEFIIDEVYKRFANDTIAYIKKNGGGYRQAGDVLADAIRWIASHGEHHPKIKKCHFPSLLFNLVKVYWATRQEESSYDEQVDTLKGKVKGNCVYSRDDILEEVLIKKHFYDLHEDCRKVLRQCWSGNPFDQWKSNLDTIERKEFMQEKSKCIRQLYENVIKDPLLSRQSTRLPLHPSFEKDETFLKIDKYWDEQLHGEELKEFVHRMDEDKAFFNSVQFMQVMRDIIRIPVDKVPNQEKLEKIIAIKTDKYIRPEMITPGKRFNIRSAIILGVIVLLVILILYLFFYLN